jgi:hypothetical protein
MTNLLDRVTIPPEVKPACWGAVGGAVALGILASTWGGWVSGATADQKAKDAADRAVVSALVPICVDKFQHQAELDLKLAELKKVSSWQQGSFIEKGGWATLPGREAPLASVASGCAAKLNGEKL